MPLLNALLLLFPANEINYHGTARNHNTELSHPPEQCGGIQHDSSERSLAHSNSHTSQKWSERELIDLGQNHAKDSANNLTIYMTDWLPVPQECSLELFNLWVEI